MVSMGSQWEPLKPLPVLNLSHVAHHSYYFKIVIRIYNIQGITSLHRESCSIFPFVAILSKIMGFMGDMGKNQYPSYSYNCPSFFFHGHSWETL
jgi:hypothetical protein